VNLINFHGDVLCGHLLSEDINASVQEEVHVLACSLKGLSSVCLEKSFELSELFVFEAR
jgi:hypothetical protein